MAAHSLSGTGSRNSTSAMSAVATISKLLSSETLSAGMVASPDMRRMGAAMSSATMPAT